MDPITIFGAATAASQVAGQGLSLSSYIFDLASKIRRAPQLMEDAALQVQLSAEALERLSETLEDQKDDLREEYFTDAMLIVESCRSIYSEMRHRISGEEKRSSRDWKSRVRWAFKTDTKIAKLNGDLKVWEEVLRRHLSLPLYVEAYGKAPHRTSMARAALINGARSRRDQRLRAYFERERERWREDRVVVENDGESLSAADVPSHPTRTVPGPTVEEVDDEEIPEPRTTHPPEDILAGLHENVSALSNAAAAAVVAADLERYMENRAMPPDLLLGFDLSLGNAARFHAPRLVTIITHSDSDSDSVSSYRAPDRPRPLPRTTITETKPRGGTRTQTTIHLAPRGRQPSNDPAPRPDGPLPLPNRPPIHIKHQYPRYPDYAPYPDYNAYPDPSGPRTPPLDPVGRTRAFRAPAYPYEYPGYSFPPPLHAAFDPFRAPFAPYYGP